MFKILTKGNQDDPNVRLVTWLVSPVPLPSVTNRLNFYNVDVSPSPSYQSPPPPPLGPLIPVPFLT